MMQDSLPPVSVIVPVYNEAGTIRELLRRLRAAPFPKQIIVVDDGSTDGTAEILAGETDITLVTHDGNRGKGAAIRSGIAQAEGQVVIIQDADLEYDPDEIPAVVTPVLEGVHDVVYGNRFANGIPAGMAWPNRLANRWLSLTVRLLYGVNMRDEATCYKAFRTDLLKRLPLRCQRFEFCPEVTSLLLLMGISIHEIPLQRYTPRTRKEFKKIGWKDGIEAFWTLARLRVSGHTVLSRHMEKEGIRE